MKNMKLITIIALTTFLGGCAPAQQKALPLVFGQSHTLGVGISASDPSSGQPLPELTLGYKDKNIAVIPVATENGNAVGNSRVGGVVITKTDEVHEEMNDTLSVLGQFQVNADSNGKEAKVGLGKFFSTGIAATKLADGFSKAMAK